MKKSSDLQIIHRLLTALQRGEYETFFAEAAARQAQLSLPLLQRLNQQLAQSTRDINLTNIRRAYATIGVDQAAALLGLTVAQTGPYLSSLGWRVDPADSAFFLPEPIARPKQREISTKQIEELTNYIAHLEEE